jgi:NAD(P)-dependent dehydrogenase (short-subunit alcohol dehydrogenase family)
MSRNAIVTGSESGIGAAIAELLRASGWSVVGVDLSTTADHVADVSDPDAVRAAVGRILEDVGAVDALVSAAGHYDITPVSEISAEALHRMLRVHLGGLRNTARAVLPSMVASGGGAIVAVTSELAIGGGDGDAHYAAAKGAVIGLVRSLAAEYAGRGVRVNAVAPGIIDTEMHATMGDPGRAERVAPTIPLRRPGLAEEVAAAIAWLMSAESSYTTGAVLRVSGGR